MPEVMEADWRQRRPGQGEEYEVFGLTVVASDLLSTLQPSAWRWRKTLYRSISSSNRCET